MIVLSGNVTPEMAAKSRYLYLPLEVPGGIRRLELSYRYDAGNILDLGLFDPSVGPFPSRSGFRGWSGSARQNVFVGEETATPGYLPGPLPAGCWQVVLGLARVAPGGCSYHVEVTFHADARQAANAHGDSADGSAGTAAVGSSGDRGANWYRGDLQSHSHHSDARGSLAELAQAAARRGLDFLAVTDHNTCSHHRHLEAVAPAGLLLLAGEEVTTYRGHANVWGVTGWVDFRLERDGDVDLLADEVHRRGGLLSINHPKALPNCLGCDWEYPVPAAADCFEAWQGPWLYRNWESLARYDELLRCRRRLTLVGGSDRHQPPDPDTDPELLQVGSPTTWLYLPELTRAALLAALKSGHGFVSEGPHGPHVEVFGDGRPMGSVIAAASRPLELHARVRGAAGDRLRWIAASGVIREVSIDRESFEDRWRWTPEGTFVRAEIIAAASRERLLDDARALARPGGGSRWLDWRTVDRQPLVRALTNPLYLTG